MPVPVHASFSHRLNRRHACILSSRRISRRIFFNSNA
jgi:hypothetical protein